jgi:hypothetical protein
MKKMNVFFDDKTVEEIASFEGTFSNFVRDAVTRRLEELRGNGNASTVTEQLEVVKAELATVKAELAKVEKSFKDEIKDFHEELLSEMVHLFGDRMN